jgi:hypothetical protein
MHPSSSFQLTLGHLDDLNKDDRSLLLCRQFRRNVVRLRLPKQPPYTTHSFIRKITDWLETSLNTDMWLDDRMLQLSEESWSDSVSLTLFDIDWLVFMNIFQGPSSFVDAMVKLREYLKPHVRDKPLDVVKDYIVSICKSQGYVMGNVNNTSRFEKKHVFKIESEHGSFEVSARNVKEFLGLIETDYYQYYNPQGVHLSELDHATIISYNKDVILFDQWGKSIIYDRKTGEIDLNVNRKHPKKTKRVRQTHQFKVTRLYPIVCVQEKPSGILYIFPKEEKENVEYFKGCRLLRSDREGGIFLYYDGSPVYDPPGNRFLQRDLHHACGDWAILKESDTTYYLVNTETKKVTLFRNAYPANAMRVNRMGQVFFRPDESNHWETQYATRYDRHDLRQYPAPASDVTFSERFAFCVTVNTPHTVYVHSLEVKYDVVPLLLRKLSCHHHIYVNPAPGTPSGNLSGAGRNNLFTYDEDKLLLNCVFYNVNSSIKQQIAVFGIRNHISHDVLKMVSQYLLFL